jgi:hypothetical protein
MTDQQHDDQHEPREDDQLDEGYDEGSDDEQDEASDDEQDEAYDAQEGVWVADHEGRGGTGAVVEDWEASSPAGVGPLIAAVVVSVLTVVVLVLAWTAFGPDDDDGARDASGDVAPAGRVGTATTSAPPVASEPGRMSRLSRCVRAQGGLRDTLAAAQPALEQWEVHVGAMNQLVVGEITLQQATAFWERTRLGAQRRVRDFDDSLGALRTEGVDCPGPAFLAPGARALPGCAREVQAAVRALEAAQVSVSTWQEHIHHMDMLRLGQMTPEQATEMWLSSWQRGVRDLDVYEAAREAADREDGCSQAGSSR